MHCVRHTVSEWAANWKTGIDAFYETYHLHAVHRQTQDVMDDMGVQLDLYPHGGSRMLVPIAIKTKRQADQDAMNPSLEYMMMEASIDPRNSTAAPGKCARQYSRPNGNVQTGSAWITSDSPTDS